MTGTGAGKDAAPVMVAFNPAGAAREPVEFGIAASRVTGAPLVIVAVQHGVAMHPGGAPVNPSVGRTDESADTPAGHLRTELGRRGVRAEIVEYHDNSAGAGLERAMNDLGPLLVVVGTTKRRGAGAVLLGTTPERVIHDSRCAVAVVPHGYVRPETGIRRIGAAYAPSDEGREALRAAAVLADVAGGTVKAVRVLDPKYAELRSEGLLAREHRETSPEEDIYAQGRLAATEQFGEEVAAIAGEVPVELDILFNEPAEGLLAAAGQLDLLVMGSRAFGPRKAVVLGSVSRTVAERSPCPVLIIPRGTEDAAESLLAHTRAHYR